MFLVETRIADRLVDSHNTTSNATASIVALAASLIGFFEASSRNAGFFTQQEQSHIVAALQDILSDKYLLALESTLSSIRTSKIGTGFVREWKHYLRHYAATGRPFGALALQKGFANFVEACVSTCVLDAADLQGGNVLQKLMERLPHTRQLRIRADPTLIQNIANIAAQEIANVEEGSDYLQLGSAWQQQLGHSVKASSLVAYLVCSLASEENTDQTKLIAWLGDALSDPAQATDPELANAVLRCLAILSLTSAKRAADMSRLIQKFLTSGAVPEPIAAVAAESLLFVLKTLPQDTTITTLYSLGNSLSTSGTTETALQAGSHFALFGDNPLPGRAVEDTNGDIHSENGNLSATRSHSTSMKQPLDSFNSIVSAIVIIAKGNQDQTTTSLAVSMLVQKVGKVNRAVDLKIITEVATLVGDGGVSEFRSLLRLYQRLHQEGVVTNDQLILRAVSPSGRNASTNLLTDS